MSNREWNDDQAIGDAWANGGGKDKPIRVMLDGVEHRLTASEAANLRSHLTRELDALRVKCPTCRCLLMPGAVCRCCADVDVEP